MILALFVVALLPLAQVLRSGAVAWTAQVRGSTRISGVERQYEQLRCIERSIKILVPAGAPVVVAAPLVVALDGRSGARVRIQDPYWKQRLTELAYPWAEVVDRRSKARYVLNVRQGGRCEGARLEVKRA